MINLTNVHGQVRHITTSKEAAEYISKEMMYIHDKVSYLGSSYTAAYSHTRILLLQAIAIIEDFDPSSGL